MTDQTSARVELLTAEVRTLMVGSRQVTLSVAKQLDVVPLETMEPFGRIGVSWDRPYGHNYIGWVIGRATRTGALVVALYQGCPDRVTAGAADLDGGQVVVCRTAALRSGPEVNAYWEVRWPTAPRRYINLRHVDATSCTDKVHGGGQRCNWPLYGNWHPDKVAAAALDRLLAEKETRFAPHAAAAELPLIVLAGLR